MAARSRLKVVLGWHMHQPEYRDAESGAFLRPWTYLHALKDYTDMAAHIESTPAARAVVNFSPVLLEQLEDYAGRLARAVADGRPTDDPVLDALLAPPPRDRPLARRALVDACRKANEKRVVARFPAYRQLLDLAHLAGEEVGYLDDAFLGDLAVWYHLAWLGESVRRADLRVKHLTDKERRFDAADRRALLEVVAGAVAGVIPRWRALAESGAVELAISPYAHPILPLLLDWNSARDAMPNAPLPVGDGYPNGAERARWHVEESIATFRRCFGAAPAGCWPSEGGVSEATLALLETAGFRWTASGQGVLRNSLAGASAPAADAGVGRLHRPYRVGGGSIACFFRDDHLSDLIGFTFSEWHADDAVAHLVHALESIAATLPDPGRHVVTIFLDGENAWEFFPENGQWFLGPLYERLAASAALEPTTFARALDAGVAPRALPRLVAGSWVYGTFSTWIGERAKNHGWELLAQAAEALARAEAEGRVSGIRATLARRQLAVCEGSDWCWWLGDANPAASVRDFDRMYRAQLAALYRLVGERAPSALAHPLAHGGGTPEMGGVMRRGAGG